METLVDWLFFDPFRLFGSIIVICLLVIFLPKLYRLYHYVNPAPPPTSSHAVTWRHMAAHSVELEKNLIYQSILNGNNAITNLEIAGEDARLAHALNAVLHEQAVAMRMDLPHSQELASKYADRYLEVRIKRILDRAAAQQDWRLKKIDAEHHRTMKMTDVEIRRLAYLVKKELESDGLSGQAISGPTS
jgi:hypothetical protein